VNAGKTTFQTLKISS